MATLSVFYIVRNEQDYIKKSIESITAIADEIVVIDTGSMDKTLFVCRQFPKVQINSYQWVHDFSKVRNFALEKCSMDWVLYLDADELIDRRSLAIIKRAIDSASPTIAAFSLKIDAHDQEWSENSPVCESYFEPTQIRLFRKNNAIKFEGKVHESAKKSIEQIGAIDLLDAHIHHFLWRGKGEQFAKLKLKYYANLGANNPVLSTKQPPQLPSPATKKEPEKISIVMTGFNCLGETQKALLSLQKTTQCKYDLYFTVNGSTDNSINFVKDTFPYSVITAFSKNEGVAKGKNASIQKALQGGSEYICVCDNDVQFTNDCLERMARILDENPAIGVVGPLSMGCEGTQSIVNQLSVETIEEAANACSLRKPPFLLCDSLAGFCMMIRSSVFRAIGLFEESFGLYGYDDQDFCLRLKKEKIQMAIANQSYVDHSRRKTLTIMNVIDWHSIMSTSVLKFRQKWSQQPLQSRGITLEPSVHPSFGTRVSIVILTHNRLDMTKDCLESIQRTTKNYELIIVDNASTDGTVDFVKNQYFDAKIIQNTENVGIPKARNQGIEAARSDFIILMDNDVIVREGWTKELLEYINKGNDIVGIEAWQIDKDFAACHRCSNMSERFDYLGGACCIFRKSVFERIGLLDEGFSPAYYEDSLTKDRCIAIRRNGIIEVETLEDLFNSGKRQTRSDGKEEVVLDNVETLSVNPQNPCPKIESEDLPEWWINRYLSTKERKNYLLHKRNIDTFEYKDYIKSRISKKIERSYKEDIKAEWKPITKIIRHKSNNKIIRLDSKHGQTCCTIDHSIMSRNQNVLIEETPNNCSPCSVSIAIESKTKKGYEFSIPLKTKNDGIWAKLPDKFKYKIPVYKGKAGISYKDERAKYLFEFLGYFASEGSVSNKSISISVCDEKLIKRIALCASMAFGTKIKYNKFKNNRIKSNIRGKICISNHEYYYRVHIVNRYLSEFLKKYCGKGSENKKIPDFIYNAPSSLKRVFLEALLSGDGHQYDTKGKHCESYSKEYKKDAFKFSSSSLKLASGLCILLSTIDKRFSVGYNDIKKEYIINYIQYRKNIKEFKKITPIEYNDYVYDLSVQDYNTFVDTMGMLVVHNTDICIRARKAGLKLAWLPTVKIKHREHATLIHGQKNFNYQEAMKNSYVRFASKMKGQLKVEEKKLDSQPKKLRILYLGMEYDYGEKNRGLSFEHDNFYPSFMQYPKAESVLHFDYVDMSQNNGIPKMSNTLYDTVQKFCPDVLFAVFFNKDHDPLKDIISKISKTTPTKTIGWFCDSHYRYPSFDSKWAPFLDYCVTTSTLAMEWYKRDGFENKVIKSQWGFSPKYKHMPWMEKDIPVSFVGQPHGDRRQVIDRLKIHGIPVQVYGTGWGKRLSFDEMIQMFNRSKINLNLNNGCDVRCKQIKGRNFEVPGCGGFLLTESAENLSDYYTFNKEIGIYGSESDMIEKIRYYLEHNEEREQIAKAGMLRTMNDHTYEKRFDHIFRQANLI